MSLFGIFERRTSLESPSMPLTSSTLLDWMGGPATDAGVQVDQQTAVTMSAVYRAVALISSVAAALPLHAYREGTKQQVDSRLLARPHPGMPSYELWRLTYVHRCLWGNAYLRKVTDTVNRVTALRPIPPWRVEPEEIPVTPNNPTGKRFRVTSAAGAAEVLTPAEVLHLPGLGYDGVRGWSPIALARQSIGTALAAESYGAKLFSSGNLLSGLLQTEQPLNQEQAEALKARFRSKMQGLQTAHDVPVLDRGVKFEPMTMPNDDAEFLASRRFQVSEISRFYGVPPFLLNETEKSTSWGTGLEQQALAWVKFDLHPVWLAPTERWITFELMPPERYAKYVVEGLLRGDSQSRAEFYRVMRDVGAFSANDIRELEDRPPVDDGDEYLRPMNYVPLGTDTTEEGGNATS